MILRIKELLKEKGVSQKDFMSKVGISQNYASNIMNGKQTPTIEKLKEFAEFLNVDIRDLFHSTKSMERSPKEELKEIKKLIERLEERI